MNKKYNWFRTSIVIYITLLFVACSEPKNIIDVEVDIYSTTTEYRSVPYEIEVTRHAIIKYSVINTGTKSVEGWEVFFNVRFDSSPQLLAFESVYYRLDPREKSSYRVVEALIPEYYENARSAKLRHIATW